VSGKRLPAESRELLVETPGPQRSDGLQRAPGAAAKNEIHEVCLDGDHCVAVEVRQPEGGRCVCDICIDSAAESVRIRDMHCDVAVNLLEQLEAVWRDFKKGYNE
jgi:hypothetical protein